MTTFYSNKEEQLEFIDQLSDSLAGVPASVTPDFVKDTIESVNLRPSLSKPSENFNNNKASVGISFSLPENALIDSVQLVFTKSSGEDPETRHTIVFSNEVLLKGSYLDTINDAQGSLIASSNRLIKTVSEGSSLLVDGTLYDVTLKYQPESRSEVFEVTNVNFLYNPSESTTLQEATGLKWKGFYSIDNY